MLGVAGEQWLADLRLLPELHFEPVSAGIAQLAGSFGVVSQSAAVYFG